VHHFLVRDVAHPQQVWFMNVTGTIPYEVHAPWVGWRELTPNGTWQYLEDLAVIYASVTQMRLC